LKTPDWEIALEDAGREADDAELPVFLRDWEQSGPVYGALSYNPRRRLWQITADDPAVSQLCKRLFPVPTTAAGAFVFSPITDASWPTAGGS
jgi:hypothetical protein